MSSTSQTPSNFPFLNLPLELRDRVYTQLVSIKHTRTPKDAEAALRSTTVYEWNLCPTIFRVNWQIGQEAKEVMARENYFVVIESVKQLEQGPKDVKKEDARKMVYNVTLWPGKATKKPVVPGERMRIKMERAGASQKDMFAHVVLADELSDVCVGLSTLQGPKGRYRTAGLTASIYVHEPTYTETATARDVRERALLEPLQKLRHFAHVSICGALPAINCQIARQLTHQAFDRGLVLSTIDEIIANGDKALSTGEFGIASAYYHRAQEYFNHSFSHRRHVFTDPADVSALEFKIMQHHALSWIKSGNFSNALKAAQMALYVADQLFQRNSSMTAGPPVDRYGNTSSDVFRKWKWECIKEGAARYGQRIKCEDIGRCHYYKSLSEHVLRGDDGAELAQKDKFTALNCCVVSETMASNVPGELSKLDPPVMEELPEGGKEEEEDEEGWVDEEWEDGEGEDVG